MSDTVLIVGASGVFGARVVRLLEDAGFSVLKAGRKGPFVLDRDGADLEARVQAAGAAMVIDAAGPFQAYGADPYRLARAALASGAQYIDLSDDAAFTAGIVRLDAQAKAQGRVCLSGASSVPALSSAVVDALGHGLVIDTIRSAILPGNRAPRGLSVIRAILAQVGQPLVIWRAGRPENARGWGRRQRMNLSVQGKHISRNASLIGAPDLVLFPARYGARTVEFRAGLELGLMHHALTVLGWLVRLRLLRSLAPLARPLQVLARLLQPFGSDRGGMLVEALGAGPSGPQMQRWTLIAEGGDGPMIPAIPALILTRKALDGALEPGARPALGEFTLAEAEAELSRFAIVTKTESLPFQTVFDDALGRAISDLPPAIAALHRVLAVSRWQGMAEVTRGAGLVSRLVGTIMRFPPAASAVPVSVTMERIGQTEIWTRNFGGRRFRSHLTARATGGISERFGPLSFDIDLTLQDGALAYPVSRGRFLGIPLPAFLLPHSDTRETVDAQGRPCFDVAISHPISGLIVRYRGWLAES